MIKFVCINLRGGNKRKMTKNEKYALLAIFILVIAYYGGFLNWLTTKAPTEETFICDKCGAVFNTQQELNDHLKNVHGVVLVDVNKQLKITAVDKWNSTNSVSGSIYLYAEDGVTQIEPSQSLSSSQITTKNTYVSGTVLWLKHYYDTTVDVYHFEKFTVPQMRESDIPSETSNPITIYTFDPPQSALTDTFKSNEVTSITDAYKYNITSANASTTMTYSWTLAHDGEGYLTSHDPVYNIDIQSIVWVKVSGTEYEKIILTGFDGALERGSAMYYYKFVKDTDLCRYKVGNNYVHPGAGGITFSFDGSGLSSSCAVTMQIDLRIYSSNVYFQTYTNEGPYDFSIAETTATISYS